MITFIGKQRDEDGCELRSYFTCLYSGGVLPSLPWGDELFDCVLVSADHDSARRLADAFSDEIVRHAVDTMQSTGPHGELIHDHIDEAHVEAQIQGAAVVGCPMTTWHDDALSLAEIAEVAELCLGGADRVLCVVAGSEQEQRAFIDLLRDRLAERG